MYEVLLRSDVCFKNTLPAHKFKKIFRSYARSYFVREFAKRGRLLGSLHCNNVFSSTKILTFLIFLTLQDKDIDEDKDATDTKELSETLQSVLR